MNIHLETDTLLYILKRILCYFYTLMNQTTLLAHMYTLHASSYAICNFKTRNLTTISKFYETCATSSIQKQCHWWLLGFHSACLMLFTHLKLICLCPVINNVIFEWWNWNDDSCPKCMSNATGGEHRIHVRTDDGWPLWGSQIMHLGDGLRKNFFALSCIREYVYSLCCTYVLFGCEDEGVRVF